MSNNIDWQKLIQLIHAQSERILKSDDYLKLIFDTTTPPDIELFINDLNHKKEAKCTKTIHGEYKIEISLGLINRISIDSANFIQHCDAIFFGIDRSVEIESMKYANLWMTLNCIDYILHHELAHIHRGHLGLLSTPNWFEEIVVKKIPNSKDITEFAVRQYIEGEADSLSASHAWPRLIFFFKKMGQTTYGKIDVKKILFDYIYSIFFLILWQQPKNKDLLASSHPPAVVRSLIFQHFLINSYQHALSNLHQLDDNEKILFEMPFDEFQVFVESAFIKFHTDYSNMDTQAVKNILNQYEPIVNKARYVLTSIGL